MLDHRIRYATAKALAGAKRQVVKVAEVYLLGSVGSKQSFQPTAQIGVLEITPPGGLALTSKTTAVR